MLLSDCGRWASALVSGHEQTSSAFLPDLLQYTRFCSKCFQCRPRICGYTSAFCNRGQRNCRARRAKRGAGDRAQTPDAEISWPQLPVTNELAVENLVEGFQVSKEKPQPIATLPNYPCSSKPMMCWPCCAGEISPLPQARTVRPFCWPCWKTPKACNYGASIGGRPRGSRKIWKTTPHRW